MDEWTYAEFTRENRTELERHWDTWITEQDLRVIAGAGLNTVRIPVGCEFFLAWSFDFSMTFSMRTQYNESWISESDGWLVTRKVASATCATCAPRLGAVPCVTTVTAFETAGDVRSAVAPNSTSCHHPNTS